MEPNIWGPCAWTFLHSITMNYPDNPTIQQKKYHLDFFNILGEILPCSICRSNYKIHLNEIPIKFNLNSKKDLVKWLFNVHNATNKNLGKKEITYEEFINIYKNIYKTSSYSLTEYKSSNYTLKKTICFLIIIIIILSSVIIFQRFNLTSIINFYN